MGSIVRQIRFHGYSMFPTIQNGDTLFLQTIPATKIKPGNIICVHKNDIYFVHRVIKMIKNGQVTILILKGDNMKQCDSPLITECQEFYKVILLKRNKSTFLRIHDKPWTAWLNSHNLTYGIIRGRLGKNVKRLLATPKYVFHTLRKMPVLMKNNR